MTAPQTGPDGPVYLTTEELAARHRTSPSSVRDWRSRGDGPLGFRFGRRVLYPLPEIERWEQQLLADAERDQRRRANPMTAVSELPRGAARTRRTTTKN
jgi:hypothetical protein